MRKFPAIFLALLVVTSGCAGLFPGSTPSPDESTITVAPSELPPGVNGQWLYNPDRLVEAHWSALKGTNYRVRAKVTTNVSESSPEWKRLDLRGHVGDGRVFVHATGFTPSVGAVAPFSFYRWNSSQALRWSRDPNEFTYTYHSWPGRTRSSLVHERVKRILSLGDFLVTGTVTRDGTTYVRLEASEPTDSSLRDISATALVGTNGRIRELAGELVTNRSEAAGSPIRITFDYQFRAAASPPSRPNWIRNVPYLTLARTDDGVGLVLRNRGRTTLPAETNLSVRMSRGSDAVDGHLDLSEPLRPNETVYFHAVWNNGALDFTQSREETTGRGDSVVFLENRYVVIDGRTANTRFFLAVRPEEQDE